jgi:DNA recombination protein RmuC
MEIFLSIILVLLVAVCGALIIVLLKNQHPKGLNEDQLATILQNTQQQSLQTLLQQLNRQQQSSEHQSGQLHNRLAESSKVMYNLQAKLAQLEEGNKRILDMSKGITELQNILQAPKLRGNKGEMWLEELLAQMLGRKHFQMQYAFKSGDVCDAVIFLRDGLILPIDSKFSLENFRKMLATEDAVEQKGHERLFISDIKKRIDEIAKKYILPGENTLNFAFMYIPAENVYYQAFVEDKIGAELQKYAFERHVIPVSPNSIYPYLEIVLFGLRGLQIEEGARGIQQALVGLKGDLLKFEDDYRKVGNNIRLAQQNFEFSDKRLSTVQSKLEGLSLNQKDTPVSLPMPPTQPAPHVYVEE